MKKVFLSSTRTLILHAEYVSRTFFLFLRLCLSCDFLRWEWKSNIIAFIFIVRIRSIIKFHFYGITIIILAFGKSKKKPINKLSRRLMTCEDFQSFMNTSKPLPAAHKLEPVSVKGK